MIPTPDTEKPIVEMNDETTKDMKIIWDSIMATSKSWRGAEDILGIIDRQLFWGSFAIWNNKYQPLVKEFIDTTSGEGKLAIDLGCGNSPAIPELLKKGWKVLAVDSSPKVLSILAFQYQDKIISGQLVIIEADVTKFAPSEPADLVIAEDILPYINPAEFHDTWIKIHSTFVKDGGFLIGNLFRSTNSNLPLMNFMRMTGAWLLPDERMVKPLLTNVGYEIEKCEYRIDDPKMEPVAIQFKAKKLSISN
jgi:SAM-dependent methyltransferase